MLICSSECWEEENINPILIPVQVGCSAAFWSFFFSLRFSPKFLSIVCKRIEFGDLNKMCKYAVFSSGRSISRVDLYCWHNIKNKVDCVHCAEEESLLNALENKFFAPFPIPNCSALSFMSWKSAELYFAVSLRQEHVILVVRGVLANCSPIKITELPSSG